MQSRAHSLLEAFLNTLSGLVLSVVVGHYLYPMFGWQPTWAENIGLTLIFTFISIARSYVWRRAFNWYHHGRTA